VIFRPVVGRVAAALAGCGLATAIVIHLVQGGTGSPISGARPWSSALAALAFVLAGTAVTSRLPSNPTGWLLIAIGGAATLDTLSWTLVRSPAIGRVNEVAFWPAISLAVPLVLLFPDGHLPSRRWRPVMWASLMGVAIPTVGLTVLALLVPARRFDAQAPLHGAAVTWKHIDQVGLLIAAVAAGAALVSVLVRWRASRGVERQQMTWLGLAAAGFICGQAADRLVTGTSYLGLALLAVVLAVGILRFGLYDLDLYLNRGLIYAILTGFLALFYVLVVGVVVAAFGHQDQTGPYLVATGVVALAFQPARTWLQRKVDLLAYGERGDPFAVVASLGRQLSEVGDPEEVLARVVETVSGALQLPYAAVELTGPLATEVAAEYGRHGVPTVAFELVYQGAHVGNLSVAPRSEGEGFNQAEQRLLTALAQHIAPVAKGVALTTELRRSRERVVRSREEERRRLRRDLHDGLGPILSGLRFGIEGVALRLTPESGERDALARLGTQADAGRDEVRRLIEDLRPGALDSVGLVGAVEEAADRFRGVQTDGRRLRFDVRAQGVDQDLPAAVEVAAYWIVTEAMHNVVRHAHADTCNISLTCDDGELEILVVDNGQGLGRQPCLSGVGTTSMSERAEEIGGTCAILNGSSGGAQVRARLPLAQLPRPTPSPVTEPVPHATLRVVLVEDQWAFREGLRSMVDSLEGFEVVAECATGEEGVAQVTLLRPDLVLMDLRLPGMDGITATRILRERAPYSRVLVLSMFGDDHSVFKAVKAGAFGYLLKDANPEEIVRSLHAVAAGQAVFGPQVAGRLLSLFSYLEDAPDGPFPQLTPREREILDELARGASNQQISNLLGLTLKTVRNNVSAIYNKLQVVDRAQAIIAAREAGLGA
jgi:two-component system, NarL family, sensor kinase